MGFFASNTLNSLGTFVNRKEYISLYPSGSGFPESIDLWYEKLLYGRVDQNNNAIFISENSLKQISSNNNFVFSSNFVVDAFNDLRKQYKKYADTNKLNLNSNIIDLNPVSGWKNVGTVYHTYISTLYENFINFVNTNERNKKITSFETFIPIFIEYISTVIKVFPITKSSFIKSKYCSPEISGLIIELTSADHSDDRKKYEDYIQDPNFKIYAKTAERFGFLVDKNAPWRLVADVASPKMFTYMKKGAILTLDDLFNKIYYRCFLNEIDILKIYIIQFYNSLISVSPTISAPITSNNKTTYIKHFDRKEVSVEDIDRKYDFKFWNRIYIFLRAKESFLILNQNNFERIVRETNEMEKNIDTHSARIYANNIFSNLQNNITSFDTTISSEMNFGKVGVNNIFNNFNF